MFKVLKAMSNLSLETTGAIEHPRYNIHRGPLLLLRIGEAPMTSGEQPEGLFFTRRYGDFIPDGKL
jgi:hypothetical protein